MGLHDDQDNGGWRTYEVRINADVVCTFRHRRADGLGRCLLEASKAIKKHRREQDERMNASVKILPASGGTSEPPCSADSEASEKKRFCSRYNLDGLGLETFTERCAEMRKDWIAHCARKKCMAIKRISEAAAVMTTDAPDGVAYGCDDECDALHNGL